MTSVDWISWPRSLQNGRAPGPIFATPGRQSSAIRCSRRCSRGIGLTADPAKKFEEHIFMHYLLIYEVAPDYLARRAQYRDVHLALAWQAAERGELLLGGAVGDPIEGSILLFSADSAAIPEAFARADPYVVKGLVTRWRVAPWRTVAGHQASNPIRAG